jgi:hypothetical protein
MMTTDTRSPVVLRPVGGGDLNFIYRTWLSDLRAEDYSALPDDLWYPAHREAITRVLEDESTTALVLCPSDDYSEILGYVVARAGQVLHWVFLRKELRGKKTGLVRMMLEGLVPQGTPAAWRMRSGRSLLNPPRPRFARRHYASDSPTK